MQGIQIKYIKELFKLAFPIILGNLGVVMMGAVDCFVAGRYSTSALAAISIANSIHSILVMLGVGLTVSISPLLSNKRGEKTGVKKYFYPSLRFSLIMSLILTVLTLLYIPLLDLFDFEPSLLADIKVYTFIVAFSAIGIEVNVALKEFLQAYEIVVFPNLVMIIAVVLNLIFNFIFVFGMFGVPELGVIGLAIATTLSRWFTAIALLLFCFMKFRFKPYRDKKYYGQLLRIGLPISAAIMIEFLAFNYIAIILGKVSGLYAAAHNIIIVLISISYMVPFGLSNALAVKVGYSNGAQNYDEMFNYIKNALFVTVTYMIIAFIIFVCFPYRLATLFTNDSCLIKIIVPIMIVPSIFQLSDGLQTLFGGIFKGLKNTKFVLISNFLAYLVLGVSLGTYLGVHLKLHLLGCWIGICVSSIILSLLLGIFLLKTLKKLPY